MPRSERQWPWRESWQYCCIGCGWAERCTNHCAIAKKRCAPRPRVSVRTAELDRRVQVTATKSWGPTLTETVGTEVAYQVAAPRETRTPTLHRANIAHQECGWKDGDRGGLAEWKQTKRKKKAKVCLDINRPSYGRTWVIASGLTTKLPLASRFWDSECDPRIATTVNTSEPISKVDR